MRVLQVDSGREWRGGQNQVWLLCRELGRDPAIEQVLVTKVGSELARRTAADGMTVRGTAWEIGLDPRAWWHLRRTIAGFQPDIIHVHDSHALTLAATVALGRTLVATRRVDFHVGRFGAWRRPDRIIAVSAAVKQMLIGDGIAADAITVVPDASASTPRAVPLAVLRIGNRVIATIPGEMTEEMGKRVRASVLGAVQGAGVNTVVLSGLANEYVSYFTTPEEYERQHYEGGSTLYGRYSSNLLKQSLTDLAARMAGGQAAPDAFPFDPNNGLMATIERAVGG